MEIKDSAQAAAKLSQLNIDAKQQQLLSLAIVAMVIIIVAIIGLAAHLFKPHPKISAPPVITTNDAAQTLEANLAHIKQLLADAKAKHPDLMSTNNNATQLSKALLSRMNAPTTFFINDNYAVKNTVAKANVSGLIGNDANSNFVNSTNQIDAIEATQLPHTEYTVPAGEVIPAVLESAINSDLPGMVRAVVSRNVYSLKVERCLIPKGATLIGQYSAGIMAGQSRVLIVWERVQLPSGIIVAVNSPSTDSLWRAGQGADLINNHFMARFATSALLSVMGAYTANAGVANQMQYNSASSYRSSIADSFQNSSQQALNQNMLIKPTLDLHQGAQINVFVAHDLSFYKVMHHG